MAKDIRQKHFLHRGRDMQIPIYLGKLLRGFLYQSDWKVFPMCAIIAALMSMVVKNNFCVTMEGTMIGSFGLACAAVWNGTFNSIQVVCRERGIIKREHRSGMHVSSYVISHMIYQALLCFAQTVLLLYVCVKCGMQFPKAGAAFASFGIGELAISLFLVSFASDMVSLFVSSVVKSTTAAMTVMPFILIFQLVFSGGFFQLPSQLNPLTKMTISHYGLQAVNVTADYNNIPSVMAWNAVAKMRDEKFEGSVKEGEIMDLLGPDGSSLFKSVRDREISIDTDTVKEIVLSKITDETLRAGIEAAFLESFPEKETFSVTTGEIIDYAAASELARMQRDKEVPYEFTVKQVLDVFTEEKVKETLETAGRRAGYKEDFAKTARNLYVCWKWLILISLAFALFSTISLKFIDKDKR